MNSFVKVEPGAGTKAVSPTLVFARKKKKTHGCNHLWLPLLALSSLAHTLPETLASSPLSSVSGSPWVGWFTLAAPLPATPCAKTLDISEVFCNYVEEKAPPLSSTSCIPSLLCFVQVALTTLWHAILFYLFIVCGLSPPISTTVSEGRGFCLSGPHCVPKLEQCVPHGRHWTPSLSISK